MYVNVTNVDVTLCVFRYNLVVSNSIPAIKCRKFFNHVTPLHTVSLQYVTGVLLDFSISHVLEDELIMRYKHEISTKVCFYDPRATKVMSCQSCQVLKMVFYVLLVL